MALPSWLGYYRGVFRTLSDIYDVGFLQEYWFSHLLVFPQNVLWRPWI